MNEGGDQRRCGRHLTPPRAWFAEEPRSLFTAAGLRDAHVRLETNMGRHPSPAEFVLGALAAFPPAGTASARPATARTATVRQVIQAPRRRSWFDDGGLAVLMKVHLVTVRT